ncbi:integrase core domain-containing protein [Bacteroides heparinolyticus]
MVYTKLETVSQWVNSHNTLRPHSSLGYRPPTPQAVLRSA